MLLVEIYTAETNETPFSALQTFKLDENDFQEFMDKKDRWNEIIEKINNDNEFPVFLKTSTELASEEFKDSFQTTNTISEDLFNEMYYLLSWFEEKEITPWCPSMEIKHGEILLTKFEFQQSHKLAIGIENFEEVTGYLTGLCEGYQQGYEKESMLGWILNQCIEAGDIHAVIKTSNSHPTMVDDGLLAGSFEEGYQLTNKAIVMLHEHQQKRK